MHNWILSISIFFPEIYHRSVDCSVDCHYYVGLCCALELGFSGTIPLHIGLPAMGTAALITGGVEAFVTISILNIIKAIRPDLLMLEKI